MIRYRYAKQRKGTGFYSVVDLELIETNKAQSFVSDHCTWDLILSENPNYVIGKGYDIWKEAVINGVEFALSKIAHTNKVEVRLIDLNGHVAHSNLYSMFVAGFLCTFKAFELELDEDELEQLYDFVSGSAGFEKFEEMPDERQLNIRQYSKT